ncbi:MAG: HlyC/CorC family transporter [bacterium]|nr:HlyC/CorC family transporter [bacterium]
MNQVTLELIGIAALILLNGFFAGSEISILSVRKSQLRNLISQGNRSAKRIAKLLEQPEEFIAMIQVGVTVAGTLASVMGGSSIVPLLMPVFQEMGATVEVSENLAVTAVVVVLSTLFLVIGELVPKYLAVSFPEQLALGVAPAVSIFAKMAYVPAKVLSGMVRIILKPFGLVDRSVESAHTDEEINLILSEGHDRGHFDKAERDLIEGVFEFADTTVRQAMTPRTRIVGLDLSLDHEQILRRITEEGYSRYPVYEDSLDNIKGVIHTKDVISVLVLGKLIIIHDLIRPLSFVPDSKMISAQLHDFQRDQQHMAIALDEFGGTAGLITLEDILEEIVGEIRDEHDTELEPFLLVNDRLCQVQGQYPIEDFNKQFEVELSDETADTVGGFVVDHIGRVPKQGEKISVDGLQFEITAVKGPRIERMRVRKTA